MQSITSPPEAIIDRRDWRNWALKLEFKAGDVAAATEKILTPSSPRVAAKQAAPEAEIKKAKEAGETGEAWVVVRALHSR